MDYTFERNNLIDVHEICKELISQQLARKVFFKFGTEIEFYLFLKSEFDIDINSIQGPLSEDLLTKYTKYKYNNEEIITLSQRIKEKMLEFNVKISDFEKEDGQNQFEVQFEPSWHPVEICDSIARFRKYLPQLAEELGFITIFKAKPFQNNAGNSMHINISLYDSDGVNIFQHYNNFSNVMTYAVAGIMHNIRGLIYLSCGDDVNSYYRFRRPQTGDIHINYPTNFSWGYNNRTCAVRIPTSANMDMQNARIEFRIPVPTCNPYKLFSGLVYAIADGLMNKLNNVIQVYGNAFDRQYNDKLEIIPKSLEDNLKNYNNSIFPKILKGEIDINRILLR